MNGIYMGVLWLVYYGLHSAFATDRIKSFFARRFPLVAKWYRLIFIVFAAVNFLLLVRLHLVVPSRELFESIFWIKIIGALFVVLAVTILGLSLREFRGTPVFGDIMEDSSGPRLIKVGIYAIIRHPMYFAILPGVIALFLYFPCWKNALFGLITGLYVIIGTLLEEHKLIRRYGAVYLAYREKTSMLIPYLW